MPPTALQTVGDLTVVRRGERTDIQTIETERYDSVPTTMSWFFGDGMSETCFATVGLPHPDGKDASPLHTASSWTPAAVEPGSDSSLVSSTHSYAEGIATDLARRTATGVGDLLNVSDPRNMLATHPVSRVRRVRPRMGEGAPVAGSGDVFIEDNRTGVARVEVTLSIVMVRWSDENCDEVKEGDSGWGPTGAVVSDSYINTWLDAFDAAFPCDYQILSVFVQSSEDMQALAQAKEAQAAAEKGRDAAELRAAEATATLEARATSFGEQAASRVCAEG